MCSYIVEKAKLVGTAKGPNSRWMKVDTANVYYDHPYEAQLDHALCVDFVCEADGGRERVAIEISRESALELIERIKAALASGDVSPRQSRGLLAGRHAGRGGGAVLGRAGSTLNSRGCGHRLGEFLARRAAHSRPRGSGRAPGTSRPRSACRD